MVQNNKKDGKNSHLLIIAFPTSSGVSERASERMSAAERVSKARRVELANEWAGQANEQKSQRTSERPTTYICILDQSASTVFHDPFQTIFYLHFLYDL